MRIPAMLVACTLLSACNFVHRIDVQQGNYVTLDAVAKMKEGMTRAEVRSALGTPLLSDMFHANRWDYYFSNVKAGKAEDSKRFSVYFENEKVVRFEGNAQPAAAPPVGTPPAPGVLPPPRQPPTAAPPKAPPPPRSPPERQGPPSQRR